jgi:hypothetical protein
MSRKQEDYLRRHILQAIILMTTICRILGSVFNVWHSMIWMSGSCNFEAAAEPAPLPISAEAPDETPVEPAPRRLPPTKKELSGHSADSFKGRIETWLEHAEISDEPIERYHELFLELIDIERFIDALSRYNSLMRRKLWERVEADKRNPLFNDPSVDTVQELDYDLTGVDESTSEWESESHSGNGSDSTFDDDSDSNTEEDELPAEDDSWSIIPDTT